MTGEVAHRHEADALLTNPGTAALVHRGVDRSLVIACPDGCGDVLTINLDARGGAAWTMYRERMGVSLFPSIWRETGCRSHFIVWRSKIYWCDSDDEIVDDDAKLQARVQPLLDSTPRSFVDIANRVGEVPWTVLSACKALVRKGLAIAGLGRQSGTFRRR